MVIERKNNNENEVHVRHECPSGKSCELKVNDT